MTDEVTDAERRILDERGIDLGYSSAITIEITDCLQLNINTEIDFGETDFGKS